MSIPLIANGTQVHFVKEQIFSSLTSQQKTILAIVTVALSCWVFFHLFQRCNFVATRQKSEDKTMALPGTNVDFKKESKKNFQEESIQSTNEKPMAPSKKLHKRLEETRLLLREIQELKDKKQDLIEQKNRG